MTFDEFRICLEGLQKIQHADMVRMGCMKPDNRDAWQRFKRDPIDWLVNSRTEIAQRVWRHILAANFKQPPLPALSDCVPLVLYFKSAEDADGFVADIQAAKPGTIEQAVQP